jgi:hypothetical protein
MDLLDYRGVSIVDHLLLLRLRLGSWVRTLFLKVGT